MIRVGLGLEVQYKSLVRFLVWVQFIYMEIHKILHHVVQLNPYHLSTTLPQNCKNEEVPVTVSVTEAVLYCSGRVC